MRTPWTRWGLVALVLISRGTHAQSALDASPNLAGAWVAPAGVLQFNLLHRFDLSPAPVRKLTNTPTLLAALGVTRWASVGFTFGSNSTLVAAYPNEWEWFARVAPLPTGVHAPVDVVVQAGYNLAARSTDAAVSLARSIGRLRLLGTGSVLSSAFDSGRTRYVAGGGATLRVTPRLALAGDVAGLTDRESGEDLAWSAGLQFGVPATPHSLSVHVTNVATRTLEGLARGSGRSRVGFEYTIPITLRRYAPHSTKQPIVRVETGPEKIVKIDIRQLAFQRGRVEVPSGTTVIWTNGDPLPHSVTSDSGTFDSSLINPGASWQRRFDQAGTYGYHCTPHPFMKGVVVVR